MANIGSLDPEERAALETMAFAEPIGPEPLAGLVSADALERLERRAVLEAERDVERLCLRLSHPLYGAVLRADTPVLPRRRIQQSLAGALEAAGARRREDPLRIATWRLAGAGHRDSRALTRAALEAIAALRFGVAERLARAAVRAGGGVAASLALGESLVRQGRSQEAEVVLSPLLPEATSDAQRAQAITLHARNLFFGKSDPAAARCLLDGDSVVDRDARDRLACEDAALLLYAGKACEALRAAEAARERAVRAETRLAATLVAAPAAALCGSTGRSPQLVEEGLSGPAISQESRAQLLLSKFTALWLAGELSQAETTADALSTFAVGQEAPDGLALVAGPLGLVALWQGRLATAIARLREAAAELRRCDPYHCLPGYLAQLAYALALVGDLAAGERVLTEAQAARHDAVRLYEAEVAVAQAWLIAGHGEISAACSILADAASVASAGGLRVFEAVALHDAARLGRAEPVAHRLRVLATHTDSDLVSLFASHATALADRDAGSLEHVAAAFEFLGATLLAAEAAAEAAATYRRKGQAGKAAAVSARSLQLGARCQGARPPALALAGESALLTPREREIARLAAEGLPSHAIAKRLVLSTRTVDNHLHHIFIKTGVAGRHELAAVLGERLAAEGSESRVGLSRRQR
jgi:DNA-binding NarL/FixJ family response regulator